MKAIEDGIYTETTKSRLEELEMRQKASLVMNWILNLISQFLKRLFRLVVSLPHGAG